MPATQVGRAGESSRKASGFFLVRLSLDPPSPCLSVELDVFLVLKVSISNSLFCLCLVSDVVGEAEWHCPLPPGHHHYPPRGAQHEALALGRRLWHLRGPRWWSGPPRQRRALLCLGGPPLQPDLQPPLPRLCGTLSAEGPGEKVSCSSNLHNSLVSKPSTRGDYFMLTT